MKRIPVQFLMLPLLLMAACEPSSRSPTVGHLAPEISGIDIDGVAFKLSDYRGKVVMLDFWGLW